MKLPRTKNPKSRIDEILKETKDKNILHIGFTDKPFTKDRFFRKELLHQKLIQSGRIVYGIDVAEEEILFLKENGISNIYNISVYDLSENTLSFDIKFDYIIFTEVIEHLANPGQALTSIYKFMELNNPDATLILTTVNLNTYTSSFFNTLLNREYVHPDHYYYFSYITLKKLIEDTGFNIKTFKYVTYGLSPFFVFFAKALNLISSSFMPSLLFEIKLRK